jgi:ABC-type polysaccharide/polyol phosphate export permease
VNQISATLVKGIKDNLMSKSALFWVIAWPILWLLLGIFVFLRGVPAEYLGLAKGKITISMVTFSFMISGMTSLAATISEDRNKGLFYKLKSMPVQPWKESIGRVLAVLTFSIISIVIILIVGISLGARFSFNTSDILISIGFLILGILSSAGLGIIFGSLVKNVQGAIMTATSIAVITSAISGVFFDYSMLPKVLQVFSRYWPMSSVNNIIAYYLTDSKSYDVASALNLSLTAVISLTLFVAGLIIYTKYCWKNE